MQKKAKNNTRGGVNPPPTPTPSTPGSEKLRVPAPTPAPAQEKKVVMEGEGEEQTLESKPSEQGINKIKPKPESAQELAEKEKKDEDKEEKSGLSFVFKEFFRGLTAFTAKVAANIPIVSPLVKMTIKAIDPIENKIRSGLGAIENRIGATLGKARNFLKQKWQQRKDRGKRSLLPPPEEALKVKALKPASPKPALVSQFKELQNGFRRNSMDASTMSLNAKTQVQTRSRSLTFSAPPIVGAKAKQGFIEDILRPTVARAEKAAAQAAKMGGPRSQNKPNPMKPR